MKQLISEFKGIVWPSKKQVKKECMLVLIVSIIGIIFIELINLLMSTVFTLIR